MLIVFTLFDLQVVIDFLILNFTSNSESREMYLILHKVLEEE